MELPPLSLYIHLPWCERKCPYCDFNSHEYSQVLPEKDYIECLLADLEADLHLVNGRPIETLFIGGGTPSLFSAAAIARLMRGIARRVELSAGLEATMEANPGSAEADKFYAYREAGINRISLGIQSFQDSQLQALGRVHTSDEAHAAIEKLSLAGINNFNIDLMHGLPGQSESGATADLEIALSYEPDHLSWYQLTIEPNTVFHKRPPLLPIDDTLADIQALGESLIDQRGYQQYEVSAYCRPAKHCRHNENYWSFGDYLGIGAGAHSKLSGLNSAVTRYAKRRQPSDYMNVNENQYVSSKRELTSSDIAGEFMLNALRRNSGFSFEHFSSRTGLGRDEIETTVMSLVDRGLLIVDSDAIRTSELGRRFLDTVVAEFF
ncbi:UNVERIFIED_CONTAM: hypothetical protein GTU68_058346 [Idotea baltica]|nr:hypothetical protein [Idotea baltica]